MNTEHRYIFEKGSKKHHCPECTKKRFVRYIDTGTGERLPNQYGRCDRESKCGYFLNPYRDGYAKAIWEQDQGNKTNWKPQESLRIKKQVNKPKRVFVPVEVLERTRAGYEQNIFIQNLLTLATFPFEVQDIEKVVSLYHLGTVQNGYRKGANSFPFIDLQNRVTAIQVKQFNEQNHTTGTDFLHSIIEKYHNRNNKPLPEWLEAYSKNETKVSCLFGEHLLSKYPYNPVALVEAPKTAVYGTLYFGFPEQHTNILWLAVYNLSSLNLNKCQALKGRDVYLFPDASKDGKAFELWSNKAAEIQKHLKGTCFHVSDVLERLAPQEDKEQGKDIADYLIKQDWRLFRKQDIKEIPKLEPIPFESSVREKSEKGEASRETFFYQSKRLSKETSIKVDKPSPEASQSWDIYILRLEEYFRGIDLPKHPVKLNSCTTIKNCSLFIKSQFASLKAKDRNSLCIQHLRRLHKLKELLTTKSH